MPPTWARAIASCGDETAPMTALTSGVAIRIGDGSPTRCRTRDADRSTLSGVQSSSVRLVRGGIHRRCGKSRAESALLRSLTVDIQALARTWKRSDDVTSHRREPRIATSHPARTCRHSGPCLDRCRRLHRPQVARAPASPAPTPLFRPPPAPPSPTPPLGDSLAPPSRRRPWRPSSSLYRRALAL